MNAEQTPANPSRRRLAKGGFGVAPVVLASLTSKNAFAQMAYQCTLSGKMSGNMSPFGPNPNRETNPSCTLNSNTAAATSALSNDSTQFNTVFTGSSVPRIYRTNGGGSSSGGTKNGGTKNGGTNNGGGSASNNNTSELTTVVTSTPATLYEVLTLPAGSLSGVTLDVLRKAVVIYYNARGVTMRTDTQPLLETEAVTLINARLAGLGASFSTSAGPLTLTPDGVTSYFNQFVV